MHKPHDILKHELNHLNPSPKTGQQTHTIGNNDLQNNRIYDMGSEKFIFGIKWGVTRPYGIYTS